MGQPLYGGLSPTGPQWLPKWELRPWAFMGWGLRFQTRFSVHFCAPLSLGPRTSWSAHHTPERR